MATTNKLSPSEKFRLYGESSPNLREYATLDRISTEQFKTAIIDLNNGGRSEKGRHALGQLLLAQIKAISGRINESRSERTTLERQ